MSFGSQCCFMLVSTPLWADSFLDKKVNHRVKNQEFLANALYFREELARRTWAFVRFCGETRGEPAPSRGPWEGWTVSSESNGGQGDVLTSYLVLCESSHEGCERM